MAVGWPVGAGSVAQLKPVGDTGERTQEAIDDWHYWVSMGYES